MWYEVKLIPHHYQLILTLYEHLKPFLRQTSHLHARNSPPPSLASLAHHQFTHSNIHYSSNFIFISRIEVDFRVSHPNVS